VAAEKEILLPRILLTKLAFPEKCLFCMDNKFLRHPAAAKGRAQLTLGLAKEEKGEAQLPELAGAGIIYWRRPEANVQWNCGLLLGLSFCPFTSVPARKLF